MLIEQTIMANVTIFIIDNIFLQTEKLSCRGLSK